MAMARCTLALAALALGLAPDRALAQHVLAGNPTAQVMVTAECRIPMKYEAALAVLAEYYDEQVGRKLAVALPEIAPRQHYDVWHDIWIAFGPDGDSTSMTMKRPADSITNRLVKSWMLAIAGRLRADFPLKYTESGAPVTTEMDIYATQRDLPAVLKSVPGMKPLATWQHVGMAVSASPMLSVTMEHAGLHGVHHLFLEAENAAALRQLMAALQQGSLRPCVCGVYSESAEIDAEISKATEAQSSLIGTHTAGSVFNPEATRKHEEDAMRAKPEFKQRIATAAGYYGVKFRPDKPYRQATVTWIELQGYVRETGAFTGERVLGKSNVAAPRPPAGSAPPLSVRMKLPPLAPGAYRIRLDGDEARVDERIFWFDGKIFEEL
jgi:hypothetical protein